MIWRSFEGFGGVLRDLGDFLGIWRSLDGFGKVLKDLGVVSRYLERFFCDLKKFFFVVFEEDFVGFGEV